MRVGVMGGGQLAREKIRRRKPRWPVQRFGERVVMKGGGGGGGIVPEKIWL